VTRAILLVDHGSRRAEANAVVEAVAERLRRRLPQRVVEVAHLEIAAPDVGSAIDACVADGAAEIVVHPYFLGPGAHTTRDIPRLVEEATRRHPALRIRVSEPLGVDERVVDVVLDRIAAAEAGAIG
jgi:sirohydrochlorin ferrochelatase